MGTPSTGFPMKTTKAHREHFKALGIAWHWLRHFVRIDASAYKEALKHWRLTFPEANEEFLHTKALGHVVWKQHKSK